MAMVARADRTATTPARWIQVLRSIIGLLDSGTRTCRDVTAMEDDPLAHLTAALRGLIARQGEIDRLEFDRQAETTGDVERWRETNAQAIDHLERTIASVPAAGSHGAIIQALIALGRLQALQDRADDAELTDDLAVVRLLLRSALPVLAESAGVDLEEHGAEHYGVSEKTAPFMPAKRA